MSEPLVHVSPRAVRVLEGGDPSPIGRSEPCVCGLSMAGLDVHEWISAGEALGVVDLEAANPTPTCPKCRIAWDTAVEKAGGAR